MYVFPHLPAVHRKIPLGTPIRIFFVDRRTRKGPTYLLPKLLLRTPFRRLGSALDSGLFGEIARA